MKISIRYFFVKSITFVVILFAFFNGNGQYGNEWINKNQQYYKIPIAADGIYFLDYHQLSQLGIVNSDPMFIQLIHRGVEQAIYIKGEEDGVFNPSDTLYFYGRKNDGTLDSMFYISPDYQAHKYYNLYSDTSAYFLTVSSVKGKRMSVLTTDGSNTNVILYKESLQVLSNDYHAGKSYGDILSSLGDMGEGWVSSSVTNSFKTNIPLSQPLKGIAELEICLVGRNIDNQIVKPELNKPSGEVLILDSIVFSQFNIKKQIYTLPSGYVTGDNLELTLKVASGRVSIAYIKLKYPAALSNTNKSTEVLLNGDPSQSYKVEIQGASPWTRIFDISRPNNVNLLHTVHDESSLTADLPSGVSKLLVCSSYLRCSITPISFSDYHVGTTADYLIITNSKIIDAAREYAAYRASKGYKPFIVVVDDLYNSFTYGEKSPIAIRRFCSFMIDIGEPKYVLLMGKGLMMVHNRKSYSGMKDDYGLVIEDLVPTFGYPASDVLFTSGLNGKDKFVPALATGRIPARTSEEVFNYLNKVREHENLSNDQLWRKNAIHLTGGKTASELERFLGYNNQLKAIYEDTLFGGKVVKTFIKNLGSGYIDDRLKYSISAAVNDGLSYLTYFGHAAPNSTEVDIGKASDPEYGYSNKGKYPMLFINGCRFSNSFNKYSYIENWILTKDKGSVIVLSDTWDSYEHDYLNFATRFYNNIFRTNQYSGKSIGEIQVITVEAFSSVYSGNPGVGSSAFMQQTLLHGDPAIIQYRPEKPDYSITSERLFIKSFTNGKATAVSDSFAIGVIVHNYGITHKDSFAISVTRKINNDKIITYPSVYYKPVYYQDTLYFVIKSKDPATYGSNEFIVSIDFYNQIEEFSENNNTANLNYFVPLSGVTCLFPKEFSIVNKTNIHLIAQSTDLLVGEKEYLIELDTIPFFTSAIKQNAIVNSGSVIKWSTTLTLPAMGLDSVVYYWRVRPMSIAAGEDTIWGESSFIYIKDSPEGWSQAHFCQFIKDNKQGIEQNTQVSKFEFTQSKTNLMVKTYGTQVTNHNLLTEVVMNQTVPVLFNGFGFCSKNGFVTLTFDRNSAEPYVSSNYPKCGRADNNYLNVFETHQYGSFINYLHEIPEGDYIAIISKGIAVYASPEFATLKLLLKDQFGAEKLDSLKSGQAYILLARKGKGVSEAEVVSNSPEDFAYLDKDIYGDNNYAVITSTLIGPAQQWGSLFYDIKPNELDYFDLKLAAIDLQGQETIIDIPEQTDLDLSTYVDPNSYPYLKLKAEIKDSSVFPDPAQLKRWQVIYKGVPEGTMNPALVNGTQQYKYQIKQEGDSVKFTYAFENISSLDFPESLKVKFVIRNESGVEKDTLVDLVALKKDSVVLFTYSLNTLGYAGLNTLQAYVNPRFQAEEYYTNNIIETSFYIEKDKTHPLLDVVFDGVHIMDGDIISPNPLITVTLKDENQFLVKNDVEGFVLLLKRPGKDEFEEIELTGNPDIIHAGQITGKTNVFSLQYNPKNLKDGIYILRVQAADVSGNLSGVAPYEIRFEVINKSSITYFYPYPNPFSSSTRFVFTLTGSEVPEDLKIQIMTVSGKVVREITKAEIGPIRIGNNKTEFAWDGTDEFGDRLAIGVYLYRVIIKNKGNNFDHRNSAGDRAFHKEFGKLYILR